MPFILKIWEILNYAATAIPHLHHINRSETSFQSIWYAECYCSTPGWSMFCLWTIMYKNVFRKVLKVFMTYTGVILDYFSFSQKDGWVAAQLNKLISKGEIWKCYNGTQHFCYVTKSLYNALPYPPPTLKVRNGFSF